MKCQKRHLYQCLTHYYISKNYELVSFKISPLMTTRAYLSQNDENKPTYSFQSQHFHKRDDHKVYSKEWIYFKILYGHLSKLKLSTAQRTEFVDAAVFFLLLLFMVMVVVMVMMMLPFLALRLRPLSTLLFYFCKVRARLHTDRLFFISQNIHYKEGDCDRDPMS